GVMLFEMLTGQLPYPPGSLNQTFRRHGCDPPADIRRLAGPLPAPLVRLVERLLARHPDDRPQAEAVVRQLIALETAALRRPAARAPPVRGAPSSATRGERRGPRPMAPGAPC